MRELDFRGFGVVFEDIYHCGAWNAWKLEDEFCVPSGVKLDESCGA